jgi:hypothetical protein
MATGAYATTSWVGPTGSWGTAALWQGSTLPNDTTAQGDIKICKSSVTSCDLDVAVGPFDNVRLTIGGGTVAGGAAGAKVLNITSTGSISIGTEFRVGDISASAGNPYGAVAQTGGSVTLNTSTKSGKLAIGYKYSAATSVGGNGQYTISGGSISGNAGSGMFVGVMGSSSGAGSTGSGSTGQFTVQGKWTGASISVGNLLLEQAIRPHNIPVRVLLIFSFKMA